MFQSVNPSISRPKRYQTNTGQKQPAPVVAGSILWPQLTGVLSQVRGRATSGCEYRVVGVRVPRSRV